MLLELINKAIEEKLEIFLKKVVEEIREQIKLQGHELTGSLSNSVRYEIKKFPSIVQGLIFMADYGTYVDAGVGASRIPFSGTAAPGQGQKGKTSKYIQGLQAFWMLKKNLTEKEALSAAFATAKKHKKEGMPTANSKKFSFAQNNKRTGFLDDAIDNLTEELEVLNNDIGKELSLAITNVISRRVLEFERTNII